jgi:hypothetical protein
MVKRNLASLLLLLLTGSVLAEESVSIEQEPQHHLKFTNEHVRHFDVELPAGYQTLMHWHRADGVFVNISSASTTAQDLGDETRKRAGRAVGETYFIGYGTKPRAHRVTNVDTTVYRVADTEVLKPCGSSAGVAEDARQTLILENERVQVTRVILHPGESTRLHGPCGMLVSVSGGRIELGGEEQVIDPAGFRWRESVDAVPLVNRGDRVFHGVHVRVK